MSDPTRPFWIDWDYDRANAGTGTKSRYGNYIRQNTRPFADIAGDYDEPAAPFAAAAWRIATGPIMSPPLVHHHERILGVTLHRSQWDGGMIAAVRLATQHPEALADARTPLNRWYRGWGDNGRFLRGDFDGPSEEDLAKGAYLLTETQVVWQLPPDTLPPIHEVPTAPAEFYRAFRLAVACVEAIVDGLNREVGALLERLER